MIGGVSETSLIKKLEQYRTEIEKGIGGFAQTMQDSGNIVKAFSTGLEKLSSDLQGFAAATMILYGAATGNIPLLVGGGLTALSATSTEIGEHYAPAGGVPRRAPGTFWPGGGRRMTQPEDWTLHPRKNAP